MCPLFLELSFGTLELFIKNSTVSRSTVGLLTNKQFYCCSKCFNEFYFVREIIFAKHEQIIMHFTIANLKIVWVKRGLFLHFYFEYFEAVLNVVSQDIIMHVCLPIATPTLSHAFFIWCRPLTKFLFHVAKSLTDADTKLQN